MRNMKKTSEQELLESSMMGIANSLTPSSVQEQLAALMLEKMQAEAEVDRKTRDLKKRQQESVAREQQKKREIELANQNACDHKKPNGTTALVCSYNHQNEIIGVCQNCGKEYLNDIPSYLYPPSNEIGGPGVR